MKRGVRPSLLAGGQKSAAKGLHRWSSCQDAVPIDLMVLVVIVADTAAVPALAARGLDFTRALVVGAAQHPGSLILHNTCRSLAEKNGDGEYEVLGVEGVKSTRKGKGRGGGLGVRSR